MNIKPSMNGATLILFTCFMICFPLLITVDLGAQSNGPASIEEMVNRSVEEVMEAAKIPGLAVAVIKDDYILIKGFGVKDLKTMEPVDGKTLFELGSCSKSFTALAISILEKQGKLSLTDRVSKFFPSFKAYYNGEEQTITIFHLLQHSSGIPWDTFGGIPESNSESALADVVRMVSGTELEAAPGKRFIYSNTNYDIAGAIIEAVSGRRFEEVMKDQLFTPLDMYSTYVGAGDGTQHMASGHKIAFGEPLLFESPVYRGNFPAGYTVSCADDMAQWLRVQLGLKPSIFKELILRSHNPFTDTEPTGLPVGGVSALSRWSGKFYSMGWKVGTDGNGVSAFSG